MKITMKYKSKEVNNNFHKNIENNGSEIPEHGMLFANSKELWVCNGTAINVYNPVSGSLIEVKEKHEDKVISLGRLGDINEEEYEIISCDEKGLVWNWSNKNQKSSDKKSFSIPVGENNKITHFSYGDKYCVATFTAKGSPTSNLVCIQHSTSGHVKTIDFTKQVKIGQYKVALSYDRRYVAALKERILYIRDLSNIHDREVSLTRHHKTGKIDLQCVAFHPTKYIIATGGMNGCITLWYQFTEKFPTKVSLHWHTTPAQTICFSSKGGDLYSGGKESVLVRWYLTDDNRRGFLPRLGMPIQNIQSDPSSSYIALLHADDSISIVNSKEMRLEGTVQRLTKPAPMLVGDNSSSKILLYHEPSASFIKAGKTGYLQFFNPRQSKVNYDLDITMTNFVSDERTKKLPNVEVTIATVSEDGVWLATVETCLLTPTLQEIILKFWYYSLTSQRWELNTTIHSPHLDTITALVFSPVMEQAIPTCVSCSKDGKFKVWKLVKYEDLTGSERNLWNSQTSQVFRGLPATACAFSQDTSLLAVAFDSVVTLWCPEEVVLKRFLTQSFLTETITGVIFSHERWKGSALVTRSENYICTWDLLSCTLLWRVYLRSLCLIKDSHTGLLAAFSNCNDVYFFDPQSSEPISSNHGIESEAVCAVFAPFINPGKEGKSRTATSTLFYYDKNQNLHRIEPPKLIRNESTEKENSRDTLTVENIEVGVKEDAYNTSDLFTAFSAKTKNITTKKSEEGETLNVDLTAPSLKKLLKDLSEVQIHNLAFSGFVDHIGSFLPNVSLTDNKVKRKEKLKYETIDEERRKRDEKTNILDSYIIEENNRIEEIQNYDFNNLLSML